MDVWDRISEFECKITNIVIFNFIKRPLRGRNNPSAIAEGSGTSYAVGSFTKAARKPMLVLEYERVLLPLNDARP